MTIHWSRKLCWSLLLSSLLSSSNLLAEYMLAQTKLEPCFTERGRFFIRTNLLTKTSLDMIMMHRIWNTCCFHKQTGLSFYFCKKFFSWYSISGINCPIQGHPVSLRSKYKGISIFKVLCYLQFLKNTKYVQSY